MNATIVISVALLAGCSNVKGFNRELDVRFSDTATQQDRDTVRTVCGKLENVALLPLPAKGSAAARIGDVGFDITKTNNQQLSALYACLDGKPGVVGAIEPDTN